ncbi:MAG: zinc ribbon domain-containing protein [Acidobacteria bacterium]|nr:zinc ribbon domain-containing protein [Acidobacteriota bacterium]
MNCATCGAEATSGLRYCKRCGASLIDTNSLTESAPASRPARFSGAAWAIALAVTAITLGGFGILFGSVLSILALMTDVPNAGHTSPGELIPIVVPMIVFGSLTILAVDFMLMKLFSRLMNLPPEPKRAEKNRQPQAHEYRPTPVAMSPPQIAAPPLSMPSITEHTTRNFDPIPSLERKARE